MDTNTASPSSTGRGILWVVLVVLGGAVIALGALLYTKSAPEAPRDQARPGVETQPAKTGAHTSAKTGQASGGGTVAVPSSSSSKTRCADCATVTAVTPVEREGQATGAGAVAGGVLGALVGNQFGGGDGKTATTIIGAVGGGMAGNEVEKRMKKVVAYQVQLRMDDGSARTLEQAAPVSVGARVRVENGALTPLN